MLPSDGKASCSNSPEPHVDWTNCDKHKKILSGRDLTGGTLQRTDFSHSDLSGSIMAEASLVRADLTQTTLRNSDLQNADLTKVLGSRANLTGSNLTGANLLKAELMRSNLSIRTVNLLGGNATPLAFSELYSNFDIDMLCVHICILKTRLLHLSLRNTKLCVIKWLNNL